MCVLRLCVLLCVLCFAVCCCTPHHHHHHHHHHIVHRPHTTTSHHHHHHHHHHYKLYHHHHHHHPNHQRIYRSRHKRERERERERPFYTHTVHISHTRNITFLPFSFFLSFFLPSTPQTKNELTQKLRETLSLHAKFNYRPY